MLRFQAESVALLVGFAALALNRAVQKVPSVKLNSRLRRVNFHHSPAGWLYDARRQRAVARFVEIVQHPIVILALAKFKLFVVPFDARTNRGRLGEIERRSTHST
jgi:hypothetical protein